jgi:hypothetical protein
MRLKRLRRKSALDFAQKRPNLKLGAFVNGKRRLLRSE